MNQKITFLISSLRKGGAERVCVTLANNFAERGIQVELVVINLQGAVLHNDLSKNVKVVNLNVNIYMSVWSIYSFFKHKTKGDKVLVFNHHLVLCLILLKMLFLIDLKIVSRNINILTRKKKDHPSFIYRNIVDFLLKMFYRKADLIIAQTSGMMNDLATNYGISEGNVEVIHNPVNRKMEKYIFDNNGNHLTKGNYILFVGRLVYQKGICYLPEIFEVIHNELSDLRLKVLGDGRLRDELHAGFTKRGLEAFVDFEGVKDEIIPYYVGSKVTILTSLYEGFPNVLLESIALGTPVVAFNCVSGPSDIILNGKNGYLVKMGDKKSFAEKVVSLCTNELDKEEIIESSRRFSSETITNKYISTLI